MNHKISVFFVSLLVIGVLWTAPAAALILEGAIGGGLGGALIGGIIGGSDGAAAGAVIGGTAGALSGAYEYDRREYYYRERARRDWEMERARRDYYRDRDRYMDCYEHGYRGQYRCYRGR